MFWLEKKNAINCGLKCCTNTSDSMWRMRSNALLSCWIQKPLGLSTRSLDNMRAVCSRPHINPLPHHSLLTVLLISPDLTETDRRGAPAVPLNERGERHLVNLPLNNVFLTGPLGPRLMDGLTEAGSISQAGLPCASGRSRHPERAHLCHAAGL